jgi:hypothetical protein
MVLRDLVFDLTRYTVPARVLPMPQLLILDPANNLPVFLVRDFEGAVALTLAGPGLYGLLLLSRRSVGLWDSSSVALVGLLSVAVVPQMLARTDLWHALYTVTPALILATGLIETMVRRARAVSTKAWVLVLIPIIVLPVWGSFWPRRSLLTAGMIGSPSLSSRRPGFYESDGGIAADRRKVIEFVQQNTTRDERVFFGNASHEWLLSNESDLYFLTDRLPGVRYTQYEPNMVTRREIQEEMIASLEKYHVRVVLLSSRSSAHEDQYATMPGSRRLDEYLASEFDQRETSGPYRMLLRKNEARALHFPRSP